MTMTQINTFVPEIYPVKSDDYDIARQALGLINQAAKIGTACFAVMTLLPKTFVKQRREYKIRTALYQLNGETLCDIGIERGDVEDLFLNHRS